MVQAPACKWRGTITGGLAPCHSPRLIGSKSAVPVSFCACQCPYVDHPADYPRFEARTGPCLHLLGDTGERFPCETCNGSVSLKVFGCNVHGRCHIDRSSAGLRSCRACTDYAPYTANVDCRPRWERIDAGRLVSARDDRLFNGSIVEFEGRRLLCYRACWVGSNLYLCELGRASRPGPSVELELMHPRAAAAREDPRLFVHRGRLWVQYAGVEFVDGRVKVHVLYARLGDGWKVEEILEPRYAARTWMEKNWAPFSVDGRLLAVYTIRPHRIVEIAPDGETRLIHETNGVPPWPHAEIARGGAPPVLKGGEYYVFYHTWRHYPRPSGNWYEYAVGVYTFSADPPYRILRASRGPILFGDRRLFRVNVTPDKSVIFPGGAIFKHGEWIVCCGHQDHWLELVHFPAGAIEDALNGRAAQVVEGQGGKRHGG